MKADGVPGKSPDGDDGDGVRTDAAALIWQWVGIGSVVYGGGTWLWRISGKISQLEWCDCNAADWFGCTCCWRAFLAWRRSRRSRRRCSRDNCTSGSAALPLRRLWCVFVSLATVGTDVVPGIVGEKSINALLSVNEFGGCGRFLLRSTRPIFTTSTPPVCVSVEM